MKSADFVPSNIYESIAILLSGMCIVTFSFMAEEIVWLDSAYFNYLLSERIIVFFVGSYFVGMIFQECGSFIQKKMLYKHNELLILSLNPFERNHQYLTQEECEGVYRAVKKRCAADCAINETVIYNFCKYYLLSIRAGKRTEIDQAVAGMSRSLALYYTLRALLAMSAAHVTKTIFCSAIAIVFFNRFRRFTIMRYVHVLRTFYYHCAMENETKNCENSNYKIKSSSRQ